MRKFIVFMVASADGYYEGPAGAFDWPVVDEEFDEFALEQLGGADGLLFGRVTYEMMAAYWPSPDAERDDPDIAKVMNAIPKLVVSRTLEHADWNGTRLIRGDAAERLTELKREPGRNILIFGSNALWTGLLPTGLIDEVRIMTMPVALGGGRSLFTGVAERVRLELLDTRVFRSGNVLLSYRPQV